MAIDPHEIVSMVVGDSWFSIENAVLNCPNRIPKPEQVRKEVYSSKLVYLFAKSEMKVTDHLSVMATLARRVIRFTSNVL